MIAKLLLTAFLALSAENLLFTGGLGLSRVLRAARKADRLGLYALFVSLFSVLSMLSAKGLDLLWLHKESAAFFRPTAYALSAAALYALFVFFLRRFWPRAYRRAARFLAPAALNSIVLALPFFSRWKEFSLAQSVLFALCTGLAFFLASLVFTQALEKCNNPQAPGAFRGIPATLLYVGILCLAFVGFSGGALF